MTHRMQDSLRSELKTLLERLARHVSVDCHVASDSAHEIFTRSHAALAAAADATSPGAWSARLNGCADVDARAACGSTLLILASATGHTAMMALLLENGADIAAGDRTATTALIKAAELGQSAAVRVLIDHGAYLDAANTDGATALIQAIRYRRIDVARMLIEAGANVDAADRNGVTALMWTVEIGDARTARHLLRNDARLDARDKTGGTALDRAVAKQRVRMAELLERVMAAERAHEFRPRPGRVRRRPSFLGACR